MTAAEAIASSGVFLLLVAFYANLRGALSRESPFYHGLNFIGAGLACFAAALIPFFPFVLLEGVWAAIAVVALVRGMTSAQGKRAG